MATNDITGARLVSKPKTKDYDDGYDRIFGKKKYTKEESESDDEAVFGDHNIPYNDKGTGFIQLQNRNLIKDNEKVEND